MRKFFFLAIAFISFQSIAQQKSSTTTGANRDDVFFSKMKYRLVGPFRGGRSAAVAGSYKTRIHFILVQLVGVFGKLLMVEVTGKMFQISISADR